MGKSWAAPAEERSAAGGAPVICSYRYDYTSNGSNRVTSFDSASQGEGHWEHGTTADSDSEVGVDANGNGGLFVEGRKHMSNTGSAKIGGTTNGNYDSDVRNSDVIYALSWSGGVADHGHYPQTSCAFHALNEVCLWARRSR